MSERFYDEEIAPALLALAKKCEAAGLSLVATCEYAEGEIGTTYTMASGASASFRVALYGAEAQGNVDSLILTLRADGEAHGHNSALLTFLNRADQLSGLGDAR